MAELHNKMSADPIQACLLNAIAQTLYHATRMDNASVGRVLRAMATYVPDLWRGGVGRVGTASPAKLCDVPRLAKQMVQASQSGDWETYMRTFDVVAHFGHSKGIICSP